MHVHPARWVSPAMNVVKRIGGDVQTVRSPEGAAAVAATRGDDEHRWQSVRLLLDHALASRHADSGARALGVGVYPAEKVRLRSSLAIRGDPPRGPPHPHSFLSLAGRLQVPVDAVRLAGLEPNTEDRVEQRLDSVQIEHRRPKAAAVGGLGQAAERCRSLSPSCRRRGGLASLTPLQCPAGSPQGKLPEGKPKRSPAPARGPLGRRAAWAEGCWGGGRAAWAAASPSLLRTP